MPASAGAVARLMRHLAIPAIIIAFSVVVIWASLLLDLSPEMIVGDSMQPRVFPIVLMILNIALAATLAIQYTRAPPRPVEMEGVTTWGSIILFVVFFLLTVYVDMMIAIAVVVFAMCLLWGERRLPVALAIAIITPSSIFLLFDTVLRVRFPRGLFTNWYYG